MVSTRSASRALSQGPTTPSPPPPTRPTTRAAAAALPPKDNTSTAAGWSHAPTPITLFWLLVSLPLVAWDTGYVLLRPWTMPGGHLHWPLYVPYALYGTVDHIYGWKAFNARNGFTSAQGTLNLVESVMYLVYVWIYFARGRAVQGPAGIKKVVGGRAGALGVVVGFSAAVMTLSKTVLYWANEYFSGFDNIGHNPPMDLLFLWIIPNGAWLLGSGYMIVSLGGEIVDGLALASKTTKTE
ncbi:hypothetical protein K456DRAFT_1178234 [Colletotrichum gloeosporioides 23]|uniref:uncharacterized protein n=1 Tax=Colletotrichum siamense TaxID=690259 RepID=UPI001872E086|nr:uncharacterized protein CGCS363_v006372 [Colletotrichum siamense]KAH9238558.1 hypothetical protein K456DRAFT_1178234 [Colletotrichum gloeosporioides 23]KAJ0281082.1 hypothetical protein COL940_005875 [Colletotrichum noveboracense]KAJ0289907.1 hypothetical protein CBS470a_004120 [Colletotrichum nupharicola]KAF5501298.1 hypothetical protein CGCS363_v006372 [Colletotrichum siamense]KAJ0326131.1 hypothetical protein Brms1b_000354 [Colletotrichum noveboracense]